MKNVPKISKKIPVKKQFQRFRCEKRWRRKLAVIKVAKRNVQKATLLHKCIIFRKVDKSILS